MFPREYLKVIFVCYLIESLNVSIMTLTVMKYKIQFKEIIKFKSILVQEPSSNPDLGMKFVI